MVRINCDLWVHKRHKPPVFAALGDLFSVTDNQLNLCIDGNLPALTRQYSFSPLARIRLGDSVIVSS